MWTLILCKWGTPSERKKVAWCWFPFRLKHTSNVAALDLQTTRWVILLKSGLAVSHFSSTWTLKLPIKMGDHSIILGVKPILKGILRVQVVRGQAQGVGTGVEAAAGRGSLAGRAAPHRPGPGSGGGFVWRQKKKRGLASISMLPKNPNLFRKK